MKIPKPILTMLSFLIVIFVLCLPFIFGNGKDLNSKNKINNLDLNSKKILSISFDHPLLIGKKNINVYFADTQEKQEKGLSGTEKLSDDQGMLFIFNVPQIYPFWMKDMNYPLDIIWIDENKKVVGVSENIDPNTYPKTFASKSKILYALEVQAGFYKQNYIKISDSIKF